MGVSGAHNMVQVVLLAVILFAIAGKVTREVCRRGFSSRARAALAVVMDAIKSKDVYGTDETAAIVREQMINMKVEHFRHGSTALSLGLFPASVRMMISLLTVDQTMPYLHSVVLHAVGALIFIFPSAMTRRTIDAFYILLVIVQAAAAVPGDFTGGVSIEDLMLTPVGVVLTNLLHRGTLATYAANIAYLTLTGIGIAWSDKPELLRNTFATLAATMLIVSPVCARMLEASLATSIRRGLERQAVQETLSAASSLLHSCCDTVVELDADGVIAAPSMNLGGMLLQRPGRSLEGERFTDLMKHEEDRVAFLNGLQSLRVGSGMAENMNISMRDATSMGVRMEVLAFRFRRLDDQLRYMVGLREKNEVDGDGGAHAYCHPLQFLTSGGQGDDGADSDAASSSCSEVAPDMIGASSSENPKGAEDPAILTVDSSCFGLHVVCVSRGFLRDVGTIHVGEGFVDYIKNGLVSYRWVQESVNSLMAGREPPTGHVRLDLSDWKVSAQCVVILGGGRDEDDEEDSFEPEANPFIRLAFSKIKRRKRSEQRISKERPPQRLLKGTPPRRMFL